MAAGVWDVVGETGHPIERVHGLEVSPERGVHAGAVDDGLVAVEVDELLEREGHSDEIAREVFDGLLVLGPSRLRTYSTTAPAAHCERSRRSSRRLRRSPAGGGAW
jgi:hypothetical protein